MIVKKFADDTATATTILVKHYAINPFGNNFNFPCLKSD